MSTLVRPREPQPTANAIVIVGNRNYNGEAREPQRVPFGFTGTTNRITLAR